MDLTATTLERAGATPARRRRRTHPRRRPRRDVLGDGFQPHDLIRGATRESAQLVAPEERVAVETGVDQERVKAGRSEQTPIGPSPPSSARWRTYAAGSAPPSKSSAGPQPRRTAAPSRESNAEHPLGGGRSDSVKKASGSARVSVPRVAL